jgi:hypothetical protein
MASTTLARTAAAGDGTRDNQCLDGTLSKPSGEAGAKEGGRHLLAHY